MKFVQEPGKQKEQTLPQLLEQEEGQEVMTKGAVHSIRNMGEVVFVILRRREGLLQMVYESEACEFPIRELKEASTVQVWGTMRREERAPHG